VPGILKGSLLHYQLQEIDMTTINEEQIRPGQKVIDVLLPTYILKPSEEEKFYPSQAKQVIEDVLKQELDGKADEKWIDDWMEYGGDDFELLSKNLAETIKSKCKEILNIQRYKLIVQITIGQMKDQGACITSRCLWNTSHDNYVSVSYKNRHIWVCALVFGLYAD